MAKWKRAVLGVSILAGCQHYSAVEQSVAMRLYLGEQYLQMQQLTHAERNFRKVVALQPNNVQGWWGLAQIAAHQGDTSTALLYYQRAFQMAPENTRLSDNYGAFLCTLGQYDEARRIVKRDKKTIGNQNGGQENRSWDPCLPKSAR
ncbi:type IV pilus assembly protein PilF [Rosenbergiella nectarea]|uniref:Type IV pilus assembly protein PilF n=1 Tax=Rosenbergiella nectarea TaxID=988801 RepID=A0A1H9JDX4_9GAMM|nr:tetratricopeptide repeat protein [Rosenbergiella nectarea]SEQ84939.1 type IV pilus assembly protein PilF [Rosenbergiella nectarea]